MALSLVLTIGTPCSGGNHFPITGTLAGSISAVRVLETTRQEMAVSVSNEEVDTFIRVLARIYRNQLPSNSTPAQIKSAIEGKTLNLTVP